MGRAPNRKLTFEKRQEIINEVTPGIILIDEFKHEKTGKYWCTYICTCGNTTTKSWNDLQSGRRCYQCSGSKTLTFEERVEWLKERNPEIILLSVTRDEDKERYNCEFKTTFDETVRVREWTNLVSKHKYVNHPRVKDEKREESFEEEKKRLLKEKHPDLELIDQFTQYDSNQLYYHYKCRCGNILISDITSIMSGKNCIKCKDTVLISLEEKQEILNKKGIKARLISQKTRKNGKSICKFICENCGKEDEKYWDNLRRSGLCSECIPNRKLTIEEKQLILNERNPGMVILNEFKHRGDWWVEFQCTCYRVSKKSWDHLQRGEGCGVCKSSKGEAIINDILTRKNIKFSYQKTFPDLFGLSGKRLLVYDFYLPEHNTIIEYAGEFHFEEVTISKDKNKNKERLIKTQTHDRMKNEYAENNGIRLLRIPYTKKYQCEEIIKDFLNR